MSAETPHSARITVTSRLLLFREDSWNPSRNVRVADDTPRTRQIRNMPYHESSHFDMIIVRERVGDSLRLKVAPSVNWLGVLTGLAVILILSGVGIAPAFNGLKLAIATRGSLGGYILGITACSVLILIVFYNVLLNLFGSEIVSVSSTDLQIESAICGFVRSQRVFPNSTVERLRYERWPGPRGAGLQHGIRFDCVGETVTFAQNLPETQSYDLIDQMRQVYSFPAPDPPDEESSPAVTHW